MSHNGFNEYAWICCTCNHEMPTGTEIHESCTRVYGSGPGQTKCGHKRCEKCKPDDFRLYKNEGEYRFPKDHFCPDTITFNSKYPPKEIEKLLERKDRIEFPRGPHTTPTQEIWNDLEPMLKVIQSVATQTCVEFQNRAAERGLECVHHRNQKKERAASSSMDQTEEASSPMDQTEEASSAMDHTEEERQAISIGQTDEQLEQRSKQGKKHHRTVKKFMHDNLPHRTKHHKKHRKDKDDHSQGGASSSAAA